MEKITTMNDAWEEIDEHLRVIYSNLGICCQDNCDASNAIYSLERVMDLLVDIREKTE